MTSGDRWSSGRLDPVVLGVVLDHVLEHVAVDRVDEDEAAPARRVLERVEENPPGRATAQPMPRELRRRVPDGKADPLGRFHERLLLVDAETPARGDREDADGREKHRSEEETTV